MRFDCKEDLEKNIIIDKNRKTIEIKGFVKPVHIVIASTAYNYFNWKIKFENSKFQQYAENMAYKNPLSIDNSDGKSHSKAIKLKEKNKNVEQVSTILRIIKDTSALSEITLSTFEVILAEIFDNFYDHAQVNFPPICCVQEWKNSNYIEIAICDVGIGIENSLSKVLKEFPNENPCKVACLPEVSSKKEKGHGGFGLYYTKEFMIENKGIFQLISGKFCYTINKGIEKTYKNKKYSWKGTIIRLILNKNIEVEPEKFFSGMPPKGETDEELF
jgi:anti-sigma regulatory factor (Ser/Thr protein kinase)